MKILYIDCDTLRPDHLGCYGYSRNTSPNIDVIAEDAVAFDQVYCADAPCLPSRAGLMTGRFGFHTGVINHGGLAADMRPDGISRDFTDSNGQENLPVMMRRRGFYTASISTFAERHSAWWFNAGFNEVFNVGKGGVESGEEVTPVALKWLADNADRESWFLHLHYWDPHTPYRAPAEFGNPFEDEPAPCKWITEETLRKHREMVGPHTAQELSMYDDREDPIWPRHVGKLKTLDDVKRNVDGYDCGIAFMDQQIGMVLAELKRQGVYEDMAIIVSADHGENMGELGIYSEHGTADEATTHIPLIIKWPGAKRNIHAKGLRYNIDLLPTLRELLGDTEKMPSRYDGESFAHALTSADVDGREYLVVSQCAHVCQRAVRFEDWIYIRTYHDGYHLFPEEMLFNLSEDPAEQNNVAEAHPELCYKATYYLDQWYTLNMKKQVESCQIDPMWTVIAEGGPYHAKGHLKTYLDRLTRTGRGWAVTQLEDRHQSEFKG